MTSVGRDLLPRAVGKARRSIRPLLPEKIVEETRVIRSLARSAPMTTRGYRFGSHFASAATPKSILPASDPRSNPLRAYFESHTEGRGIWKGRHYFDIYVRHLERFVGRPVHVVEIGVYSGGSLEMWRKYFGPESTIYGVDLEEACRVYEGDGVRIFVGDQGDRSFWKRFKKEVPFVDVVIDDGGHAPDEMRVTFEELMPILRPGGVYICEDIGTDNTFLPYLGGLAQHLVSYSGIPLKEEGVASGASALQRSVESIHLYPLLAVIERTLAPVTSFQYPKHGSEWQPFYD